MVKRRFHGKRRFRRSRGGTWFPVLGSRWGTEPEYNITTIQVGTAQLHDDRADGPVQNIWPLTKDLTQEPTEGNTGFINLRDFVEGQNYVIDRIVGEIPLNIRDLQESHSNPAQNWWYAQVAAGIFVAKVSDADQSLPMGVDADYDPFACDNAQNPWMWRRTWMLADPQANTLRDDFPISNTNYVGDSSGSHIDIRAKRIVRREERLFLVVAAIGWNGDQVITNPVTTTQSWVQGVCDLRIFGRMKRGKNPRTF